MIYNVLGKTDIKVSKIAFGSLTMGPLQRNLTTVEGASLIKYAYDQGINFIDTAELYETYGHIREALKVIPREKFVIASKSYAYSRETAKASFEKAIFEMDTDYIDVFMLHEQMNALTLKGHYEAIEYFLKLKEQGRIKAIGVSTHYVECVRAILRYPEIEVVHPITNVNGLGIQDGSRQEMELAIRAFKNSGGGVFGMKPLGGGNLLASVDACFDYVLAQRDLDAIAFGMQSKAEIDYNVRRVEGLEISESLRYEVSTTEKKLQVADWCTGCGACVKKCDHKALRIQNGQAVVARETCVLCGYCASVCPEFCIKVY